MINNNPKDRDLLYPPQKLLDTPHARPALRPVTGQSRDTYHKESSLWH
jgi:hypothetical protein